MPLDNVKNPQDYCGTARTPLHAFFRMRARELRERSVSLDKLADEMERRPFSVESESVLYSLVLFKP